MHDIPTQIYREIWDMRWTLVLLAVTVMFISSLAYAEVRKVYYESGRLQAEENYKGDKLEGITKTYYESGQLQGEGNFKDGKQEGTTKTYYESGQLEGEGNFKDGKPEGIIKTYYESGQLEGEANFKNGVIISEKKYNEDGKLKFDQDYPTE